MKKNMDNLRKTLLMIATLGCLGVEAQGGNLSSKGCFGETGDLTIPLAPLLTEQDKISKLPKILRKNKVSVPINPLSEEWRERIHSLNLDESWEREMALIEKIGKSEESLGFFDSALLYHWRAGVEQFWPNSLREVIRLMDLYFEGKKTRRSVIGMLSHYPRTLEDLKTLKLRIDHCFANEAHLLVSQQGADCPSAGPSSDPNSRNKSGDSKKSADSGGESEVKAHLLRRATD